MHIDKDSYVFDCSGRRFQANRSYIGISPTEPYLGEGTDGTLQIDGAEIETPEYELSQQERHELADYMIGLWRAYRDERMGEIEGSNPMIQSAMDAGDETTGLCTVREWARAILEHESSNTHGEMWFMLDGKKVTVDVTVTVIAEESGG